MDWGDLYGGIRQTGSPGSYTYTTWTWDTPTHESDKADWPVNYISYWDALRFVNSPEGKALHLRGVNARVLQSGTIRPGDAITFL